MADDPGSSHDLPLDRAFDEALEHLSACRVAWEEDPRDPDRIARLGAARAALEDARVAMNEERVRLGLEPRVVRVPDFPLRVDSDGSEGWQGIHT